MAVGEQRLAALERQIEPPPTEPTRGHGKRNYPEGGSPS